ncbi:MAG TPA: YggT family protein [Gammaproteobacteria bacterium]|jgi:YggT family protein|nr:YggT family protein [Gammaproteobacteria bacterium]
MSGIYDASLFLITTLFDLYLFVLAIRVLLAYSGANYYDPAIQFIVRLTDVAVKPLRRIIPNIQGIEISTLLLILALEFVKYFLITSIGSMPVSIIGIIIIAFADSLKLFLLTFFYSIIAQAILSWVQPMSPVIMLLYRINAPIMRPIQRLVPNVGGMDISPIPAIILLQLTIILIVNPLMALGLGASLG